MHRSLAWMVVGGTLVALGFWMGQGVSGRAESASWDQIRAREITVVDASGAPALTLTAGDSGGVLLIQNGQGNLLAVLGATENGSGLVLFRQDSPDKVFLGNTESGTVLQFSDKEGNLYAALRADVDGSDLALYDREGRPRAALSALPDGAMFSLLGSDGRRRVVVGVSPLDAGTVATYNEAGKRSGILPSF